MTRVGSLRAALALPARDRDDVERRYSALRKGADGVAVAQGECVEEIEPLTALDEELGQSDRFLEEPA